MGIPLCVICCFSLAAFNICSLCFQMSKHRTVYNLCILENPRDREAWWAAVYGVTQSRTRLKRLSSSSSKFMSTELVMTSKLLILCHPLLLLLSIFASIRVFSNESTLRMRWPPRFMSIESVILSNHLILCHPLLLLHSIFPSIRVFSNELSVRIT